MAFQFQYELLGNYLRSAGKGYSKKLKNCDNAHPAYQDFLPAHNSVLITHYRSFSLARKTRRQW